MDYMKLVLLTLLPGLAAAAIFPDTIGPYQRGAANKAALSNQALWDEYGLKSTETATYKNGKEQFTATAYRLLDSTAALGAFDWQLPADAKPSSVAPLAVETGKDALILHGNYVFRFQGYKPTAAELATIWDPLRDVDPTPLPTLTGFLPSRDLVPNSERYIIGPTGLQQFVPGIPPSVAAFHLGAEAQSGVFRGSKGDMTLAVFNYPTHQIAMQKEGDFRKIGGAVVKRSGPLIAVVLNPADPDAAERLLAQVRYEAQVTLDERVPNANDNPGNMLTNIFVLTGILLGFCIVAGLFVGGFRAFLLGKKAGVEDPMILLHLEKR